MVVFNLADSYRAAGLTTGPEILHLRKAPCEQLIENMDALIALDLVRLYFEIPLPRGMDWFLDAFRESDASFSLYENQREATVLAAALLESVIANGNTYAALALLTGAAGGARKPPERAELLDFAKQAIGRQGVRERERQIIDVGQIKKAPASKLCSDLSALETQLQEGAPKIAQSFKLASSEAQSATNNLAGQAAKVLSSMEKEVINLREQIEMLWWFIGGWSRLLERPFVDIHPSSSAVMAGIDLADLSCTVSGPVAAPVILERIISNLPDSNVSLMEAVDGLSEQDLKAIVSDVSLTNNYDIFPVLAAISKANEIGGGISWHKAFARDSGLEPSISFKPVGIAMQAYRERLLSRMIFE